MAASPFLRAPGAPADAATSASVTGFSNGRRRWVRVADVDLGNRRTVATDDLGWLAGSLSMRPGVRWRIVFMGLSCVKKVVWFQSVGVAFAVDKSCQWPSPFHEAIVKDRSPRLRVLDLRQDCPAPLGSPFSGIPSVPGHLASSGKLGVTLLRMPPPSFMRLPPAPAARLSVAGAGPRRGGGTAAEQAGG